MVITANHPLLLGWKNIHRTFRVAGSTAGKLEVSLVKQHAAKGAGVPFHYTLTVRLNGLDLHKALATGTKLNRSSVAAIKKAARASR